MQQKKYNSKEDLILKIKDKKELSGLANSVVVESLQKYLTKYNISLDKLSPHQSKILIKEIRADLRLLTGRFQKSQKDKLKLINSKESLLKTHTSTFERLDFYPDLKRIIKDIKPRSILDLGSGLNPIALANSKVFYFAADINEDDLLIVKLFFQKNKIEGKTFVYDLRKIKENLPKTDLCLIFKVLDIIDDKRHKLSEKIILNVPSKVIIVSFSTKKLSGKPMNFPNRFWFENLLKKLEFNFEKIETKNEVFYLIKK